MSRLLNRSYATLLALMLVPSPLSVSAAQPATASSANPLEFKATQQMLGGVEQFFGGVSMDFAFETTTTKEGKVVYHSAEKLDLTFDRPQYHIEWDDDVTGVRHQRISATYDGKQNSLLSEDMSPSHGIAQYSINHTHPQWIDESEFLRLLGIHSLAEDDSVSQWLARMEVNPQVTVSFAYGDDGAGRLTVQASWQTGRELYVFNAKNKGATGILEYELSYGTPAKDWTKVRVTDYGINNGFLVPKAIDVEVVNSISSMKKHCVVTRFERRDRQPSEIFHPLPVPPDCIGVDSDERVAFRMTNGRKTYVPYFDAVTGESTVGPRAATTGPTATQRGVPDSH